MKASSECIAGAPGHDDKATFECMKNKVNEQTELSGMKYDCLPVMLRNIEQFEICCGATCANMSTDARTIVS